MVLLSCPAIAAEQDETNGGIGRGLICNSADQAQRFVEFRNSGQDTEAAIKSVNDEARDPIACGPVTAAFSFGKTVRRLPMLGQLVSIVEVIITAMSDGTNWNEVPPTIQYTIVAEAGEDL